MPASLSDQTSTYFDQCASSDPLAARGKQYGYALTVSLSAFGLFAGMVTGDAWDLMTPADAVQSAAGELWRSLQEWSRDTLVPEYPLPVVVDGTATILAVTLGNASTLTCGELVRILGERSPLAIVQLKRVPVEAVRGSKATETRGDAQSEGAAKAKENAAINPLGALEGVLKTLGIGIAAALVVALVVLGVVYFRKR